MSKEEKLRRKADKIAAKQAKLESKKQAKLQGHLSADNYVQDSGSGWRDEGSFGTDRSAVAKPKKPFYKRWWFIAICVIVIISIIGEIGSALGPNIKKDFSLGKTAILSGMEYQYPSGWTVGDSNTETYAKYTKTDDGDFVGSAEYYYYKNGDKLTKGDIKSLMVTEGTSDITYGKTSVKGASECRTADYSYTKKDTTYYVRDYLIRCDGAVYGVKVTAEKTVDTDTADKIAGGFNLNGYNNKTTLKSISATYLGATKAGTAVTPDSKIYVLARYSDGTIDEIKDYTMTDKALLKADGVYNLKIHYDGKTAVMKVVCSTMSAANYKSKCTSYSYSALSHKSTTTLLGKMIRVSGNVTQVIGTGEYMIDVSTGYDFGNYVYIKTSGKESKIVEDDNVTFYGVIAGDYSYETVLGAEKTIPGVKVKYVSK